MEEYKIGLVVITDGRSHCIKRFFPSFEEKLIGNINQILVINDSGKIDYAREIERLFPSFRGVPCAFMHHTDRLGFGETVRTTMELLPKDSDFWVWGEDDFTINRPIILDDWCGVLENNPDVVQIAAYRQPWSQAEIDAGGFFYMRPGAYKNALYKGKNNKSFPVVENKSNFTTNVNIFPRWIVDRWKWPNEEHSEGKFGFQIFAEGFKMLYWGQIEDSPLVTHDGQRQGTGY